LATTNPIGIVLPQNVSFAVAIEITYALDPPIRIQGNSGGSTLATDAGSIH
jgi:hypothetical protein